MYLEGYEQALDRKYETVHNSTPGFIRDYHDMYYQGMREAALWLNLEITEENGKHSVKERGIHQ